MYTEPLVASDVTHPVTYRFLRPFRCRAVAPNGDEKLVGFGIGDSVVVNEPAHVFPVAGRPRRTQILLADGWTLLDPPEVPYERSH